MKLKTLALRNFKGIRDFTIPAEGQNLSVYGANESGKTSLYDSWLWLLFGKDSLDRKDFGIKPAGQSGVDTEVEAVIDRLGAGEITLKKAYKEIWSKKRGNAQATFTGNTVDHYFNGVPVKQNEYQAYIKSMVDEELFRLLTNPRYFNEVLKWERRRELLLSMAGVEAGDMKGISDKLKVAKAKQTEINRRLKDIPTRIDEANRALPAIPDKSPGNIGELRQKLQQLQERKAMASTNEAVGKLKGQIAEAEADLLKAKNQQRDKIGGQIATERQAMNAILTQIGNIDISISTKRREVAALLEDEKSLRKKQTENEAKGLEIKGQQYNEATCPVLGEPCDRINSDAAKAAFNLRKSETLKQLRETWKANKEELESIKRNGDVLIQEINGLNQKIAGLQVEQSEHQKQVEYISSILKGVDSLPECEAIRELIVSLNQSLQRAQQGIVVDTSIDQELAAVQAEIERSEQVNLTIKQREAGLKRIEELKAEEKKLAAEYEAQEASVYQIESDMRVTVENLEGDINGKFETLNFKLFNTLINGGIEDCCIASSKAGVPYPDMSNSQKIRAGLEIIKVFSKHYGTEVVVFVDNSESISYIPDMGSIQVISLIVSPEDKSLRVEIADKCLA